jgi:hypothetical protein
MLKIEELPAYCFTWQRWRAGSLSEFGLETRTYSIEQGRRIIREYAIGYIDGNKLWVRAKNNTIAILFYFKDNYFWTHLTINEFNICFPELQTYSKTIMN